MDNVHGSVEGIAADNHVQVGGGKGTGLSRGIKTLSGQGRARETKTGLDLRNEGGQSPEGWDGVGLHLDVSNWSY